MPNAKFTWAALSAAVTATTAPYLEQAGQQPSQPSQPPRPSNPSPQPSNPSPQPSNPSPQPGQPGQPNNPNQPNQPNRPGQPPLRDPNPNQQQPADQPNQDQPNERRNARNPRPFMFQTPQDEARFNQSSRRLVQLEQKMEKSNQDLLKKLGEARTQSAERQNAALMDVLQQMLRNQAEMQQYLVQARTAWTGDIDLEERTAGEDESRRGRDNR